MSVSLVAGQLPPVFFICLIMSFLWLRNFLHLNIKLSTVFSSSSQGHIRFSVSPSLYKYSFMLPCPVNKVIISGNIGIFSVSLFFTDGKKAFVTVCVVCVCVCMWCVCGVYMWCGLCVCVWCVYMVCVCVVCGVCCCVCVCGVCVCV